MKNEENYIEFNNIFDSKIVAVDLFEKKISIKNLSEKNFDQESYLKPANKDIKEYINNIRQKHKNITFTVVTTQNCNLSCTYCYEKKYKDINKILTKNKCNDICQYILKYINYYNSEKVKIIFTGGEPLLNKEAIFYIVDFFSNNNISKKVLFTFSIITNGTISLSKEEFRYLNNNGLDLIQVSLDGPKEIHNKRRLSNFDAYQKTKDFLLSCSNFDFLTVIRTNIDNENIDYYQEMLNNLNELKSRNIIFSLYQTEKTICDRCITTSYKQDQNILIRAMNITVNSGFNLYKQNLFFSACISLVEVGQFIDTQGNVYKCGGMLGHKEEIVGDIYNFEEIIINVRKYINKKLSEDCFNCRMFPICTGGCIYNKYYNKDCDPHFKMNIYNKIHNSLILYLKEKGYKGIKYERN